MECSAGNSGNAGKLRKKLGSAWRFEDDGSIRDIVPFPTEVVSPILCGTKGEKKLREACLAMKDLGFNADHLACGMHVHMGAEDYKQKDTLIVLTQEQYTMFLKSTENVKDIKGVAYVNEDFIKGYYRLKGRPLTKRYRDIMGYIGFGMNNGELSSNERGNYFVRIVKELVGAKKIGVPILGFVDKTTVNEVKSGNKARLKELEKKVGETAGAQPNLDSSEDSLNKYISWQKEYTDVSDEYYSLLNASRSGFIDKITKGPGRYVLKVVDREHTNRLINLLLFYLIFDDVFLSMLPCSRRDGNSYCMPLSTSFTRDEVVKCRTQDDFEKLWYKDNSTERVQYHKRDHYDNSRYHNVNFHSLFNRHGTVEIRSHGATINPNKILLWTALHQHILDAVSTGVSRDTLESIPEGLDVEKLCYRMFDILNLPDHLRKYVMRLVSFYSDVKF